MKIVITYTQEELHVEVQSQTSDKSRKKNIRLTVMKAIKLYVEEMLDEMEKKHVLPTVREQQVIKQIQQRMNKAVLLSELVAEVRKVIKAGKKFYHAVDKVDELRFSLDISEKYYRRICTLCRRIFFTTRRVEGIAPG